MIQFEKFTLSNGLRVIHHRDPGKSSAVVNILYNVGARDEDPEKTGFAHLFEHLMFGGSENIPSFDGALQNAGGTNNAFTTNDLTNYYIELPVQNLETAFWLESDRMKQLAFSQQSLDVQKGVVIEEFKQRYLNQPYGQAFMHIRENAYTTHPYRWATIGKEIKHIEEASLEDVKDFFNRFYTPSNAIMCVAGNLELNRVKELCDKWFAPIPSGSKNTNQYPTEPQQKESRHFLAPQSNAQRAIYLAFHKGGKHEKSHYSADLLSDVLSSGKTSFLFRELVEKNPVFSSLSAYVGDELDPGLFYISGKLNKDTSAEQAETAIWNSLELFGTQGVTEDELNRRKNKLITARRYQETHLLNKAMALCAAENMGKANLVNETNQLYNSVSIDDVNSFFNNTIRKENSSSIVYDKLSR